MDKSIELDNIELNMEINKSQLRSIESSPFISSKSMAKELETQLLFRKKYIDIITQIRTEHPRKPLIILESYDFICSGCPANYVTFFNDKVLITYQLEDFQNKHIDKIKYIEKERFTDLKNSMYDDLKIIYKKLDLKTKWNSNPVEYGTEYDCSDGGKYFYSVYLVNGTIESMYMRCWTAKLNKQN
ncbi:hypothetical protein [Tenacibaculum ovolyticum]|uniref:hypothetical protein n=1 Tax=Tenacibaculum ovolyticum TaxID=104270 RepID=UPI003BAAB9CD